MLPDPLKLLIASGIAFLVTEGEKIVGQWLGKDLSGAFAAFAAALTTAVIVFAEGWLALVPVEYQSVVQGVFVLLIAVLGAFGIHKTIRRFHF